MENKTNENDFEHDLQQGVRLSTRDLTSVSKRVGVTTTKGIKPNIIQEEPWDLNKMLERYSYISTLPWVSTELSHNVLGKFRIPQDLIVNGLTSAPFNNFTYWNGTIKLKFQVIGSPMTQGCAVAVFIPLTNEAFIESNIIPNFSSLSINQTNYLFANVNTSSEMSIPFNNPQAYINLPEISIGGTQNTLGYLYFVVFNQIALSAGTPDNVAISLFSRFEDNEFKVPRRTAVTRILGSKPQSKVVSSLMKGFEDALKPENVVGDVIDLVGGLFGMDDPIDPGLSQPNNPKITQRMNFGSGVEYIDKLSVCPSKVSTVAAETFATVNDEMDFEYLKKKYSYLGSFTLKTINLPGDIIASFPISPMPDYISLTNTPKQLPLISYLSLPYNFWKGGLTYKMQVVSTSMQTSKIFISFNFGEFTPSSSGILPSTSSQYGEAFEINQGSNTFEFSVPYVSITPELYVPNSNVADETNSLGMINVSVMNPLVSPNNSPTFVVFNLFIAGADDFALSTLSTSNHILPYRFDPATVIPRKLQKIVEEVDYDDMYEVIRIPSRKPKISKPQSAAQPLITPMSNVDLSHESLVAPNLTTTTRSDIGQQKVTDIRQLMKKYHMFTSESYPNAASNQFGTIFYLPISDLFGWTSTPTTTFQINATQPIPQLWAHYQSLYRQFKGSLNFKIMLDRLPSGDYTQFSVFYQPPNARAEAPSTSVNNQFYPPTTIAIPTFNGTTPATAQFNKTATRLPVIYSNSINKTAEFSIPYSSRFLSIISKQAKEGISEDYSDLGYLIIYNPVVQSTPDDNFNNFNYNIYFSFGDDARFGTLFNVPYVLYNPLYDPTTGNITGPAWPDTYSNGSPIINTLIQL